MTWGHHNFPGRDLLMVAFIPNEVCGKVWLISRGVSGMPSGCPNSDNTYQPKPGNELRS